MTVDLSVVLVAPKEDGNVGAVARVMSNFGVRDLVLVGPRARLGEEGRRRAMAGLPIFAGARVVRSLEQALEGMDLVVGTTDLSTGRTDSYLRRSSTPEEWGRMAAGMEGHVALLFGPEDNGLRVEELARCDLLVWIPTSPASPTLNLSHAVAIVLYATYLGLESFAPSRAESVRVNGPEKEVLLGLLEKTLVEFRYPRHKRDKMLLLYRRILGRAMTSDHEYAMLMGLFRRILYTPRPPPERRTKRSRG